MNCTRCRGLMVEDHLLDFEGTSGYMWTKGYRCMNCGHIHDPVIEQHRLARQGMLLVLPSGEPDYGDEEVHLGAESFIVRAA